MENRKKVYITGTSRGIGLELKSLPFDVIGTTRAEGFDIEKDYEKVLSSILESNSDVFINNAHDGFHQVEMLNTMFTAWQHKEGKHIINIGVDTVPYTDWQVVYRQYPIEKMALHAQCEMLHNDNERKCKITNLALGYVDTEFNKDHVGPKLSYDEILNTVEWIVEQPAEIKQLILSAK